MGENFNMRAGTAIGTVHLISLLACTVALAPATQARAIRITAPSIDQASAPPTADDATDPQASQPLTADESAMLGKVLSFDPVNPVDAAPAPALHLPSLSKPQTLDLKRTDNADGSSAVSVKQPLATSELDTNVGADLNTAPSTPTIYQPGKPFPGTVDERGSGAAWASIGVSNLASVDARVEPINEQGKLGTNFKHSVPIGDKLSVTIQGNYSLAETYNQPSAEQASISGLPLRVAAAPDPRAQTAPASPKAWGSDKSVKLDILSTGTTFSADIVTASNDPITHNTISADQKLLGPLHVTTAMSDIGQPVTNKSITAGFTLKW
jgi:hypothetical protein